MRITDHLGHTGGGDIHPCVPLGRVSGAPTNWMAEASGSDMRPAVDLQYIQRWQQQVNWGLCSYASS